MHTQCKRLALTPLILALLTYQGLAQVPTIGRIVQCSDPATRIDHELIRGESIYLEYRYEQTGVTFSVQAATNVALRFRSSDMTNTFYSLAGTVTGSTARFLWAPAYQVAATTLTYSVVLDGATGANMRAYGTIKQLGSVQGVASNTPTVYIPTPWADAISVLNTALTVSASWTTLTGIPTVWNGTATDTVARAGVDAATNRIAVIEANTSRWESAYINSTQWLASVAYSITSGLTNQWTQGYIAGTNWLASAAYGITSGMVANWNSTTNWLTSVAYAITAGDTNNWTTAWTWGNHGAAGYLTYTSTQTIAGASVSGTVPSASVAGLSSNTLAQTLANGINTGGYDIDFSSSGDEILVNGAVAISPRDKRLYDPAYPNTYFDWAGMVGYYQGNIWIDAGNRTLFYDSSIPVLRWSGVIGTTIPKIWWDSVDTAIKFEIPVKLTNSTLHAYGGINLRDPGGVNDYAFLLRGTNWAEADALKVRLVQVGGTNSMVLSGPDGTVMTLTEPSDTFPGTFDFYGPVNLHAGGNVVTQGVKIAASTNADYAASAGTAANSTNLDGIAATSYPTNYGPAYFQYAQKTGTNPAPTDADFVTQGELSQQIAGLLEQTVYGATNQHATLGAGYASFLSTLPANLWTNSYTLGTSYALVGNRFMTNALASGTILPAGAVFHHHVNANVSALNGGVYYSRLVLVKSDLSATQEVDSGSVVTPAIAITEMDSVCVVTAQVTVASGTWFLGVERYAKRDVGAAVTLNIYGGDGNPTRLEFPSSLVGGGSLVAADSYKLGGIVAASYVTNNGATVNGQAVSNGAVIAISSLTPGAPSNTLAAAVTNLAGGYFDAYKTVYYVSTYSLGTITVSRAWGDSVAIGLTNNATITFSAAEWPSNSMGCVAVSLHPNGFSTTFAPSMISTNSATNTIPGSAGLVIQTNAWNLLTFAKGWGWTVFGVHDR